MYISATLSHRCTSQLYFNRKNYTSFKQDTKVKIESTQQQAKEKKSKILHTAWILALTASVIVKIQAKEKKSKILHTAWILALTASVIVDGVLEHRSYKKNKATNEVLKKGKEITDKTIKELEENTRKIKEDLQKKEQELEQLKSKLNTNNKNDSVNEFDKYLDISDKIINAKEKHSK